jgi:hypothetical protein
VERAERADGVSPVLDERRAAWMEVLRGLRARRGDEGDRVARQSARDRDGVPLRVPRVEGRRLLEPRRPITGKDERDPQALVRQRLRLRRRLEEHRADGELPDVVLAMPPRMLHRLEEADEERRSHHVVLLGHRVLEPHRGTWSAERLEHLGRRERERDRLGEPERGAGDLRLSRQLLPAANIA